MCGIAGFIGTRAVLDDAIQASLATLRRRGPDDAGFARYTTANGRHIAFLHTRLRIIDLDPRSNQPFTSGDVSVVFNGEIYNYLELKGRAVESLARRGAGLRTKSDTEILTELLNLDGLSTLDRIEGMFAFAAYDARTGEVHLARDRFGEKPLYVHRAPEGIYFASEIAALSALAGKRFVPNKRQLLRYLINGYKSLYKSGETFFEGVDELKASHSLTIDAVGNITTSRYWALHYAPDESMTLDQAREGTRERLERALEIRLRADVPIAFCMSGGVDSNALIGIAKKKFGADVHGFTISNEDPRYNENSLVHLSRDELGVRHTEVMTKSLGGIPELRDLVRYHGAPVATISYFLHWELMRRIADAGYKVSVSGTAADELFSGYYDHNLQYLHDVRGEASFRASHESGWTEHIKPIVRNPFLSDPNLFANRGWEFRDHIYLNADVFRKMSKLPFDEPFSETEYTRLSLLRNRMMNELFAEAVPVILREDDLNAMYYSIENRSPYLDRELAEFVYTVPTRWMMRDGFTKALLRDAARGYAPDAVLDSRRKVGFNAPLRDFIDPRLPHVRDELLRDSPIFDLLDRDQVVDLFEKDFLPNSESKFLFYFVSSKLFLEEYS